MGRRAPMPLPATEFNSRLSCWRGRAGVSLLAVRADRTDFVVTSRDNPQHRTRSSRRTGAAEVGFAPVAADVSVTLR